MSDQNQQLIEYAGGSDIGLIRERNEDSILMCQYEHSDVCLFVVADGVGGHKGGDIASQLAVETIQKVVGKSVLQANSGGGYGENWLDMTLRHAIVEANGAILEQQAQAELENMATTVVCALVKGEQLVTSYLGDSRCYLFQDDELQQLTEDHTMLRDMLNEGAINQDLYESIPLHNMISKALGIADEVEPEATRYTITEGQTFLLCTDGLTNNLEDAEITAILQQTSDAQECIDTLITQSNDHGGTDNISIVLFRLTQPA